MQEKNICVDMYKVPNSPAAFVEVGYKDRKGCEHTGLMLLDTAANANHLLWKDDLAFQQDEPDRRRPEWDAVRIPFTLGDVQFDEKFVYDENASCDYRGELPLIGVLGNIFMQNNNLVIDYSSCTVHTSTVSYPDLEVSDYEFFYPMVHGLKNYGVPSLSLCQGNLEVVALVDTGQMRNQVCSSILCDDGFHCEYEDYQGLALFMSKCIETTDVTMDYMLLTILDNDGHPGEVSFKDDFEVYAHNFYTPKPGELDDEGEPLEPAEAVIGAKFMAREGWTIDFGLDAIYKERPKIQSPALAS